MQFPLFSSLASRAVPVIGIALALGSQGTPDVSVWEKPLAPGVTLRIERDRTLPRDVYAVRITPGSPGVEVVPALAGGTVYDNTKTFGRGTVTSLVGENQAELGINADFFPLGKNYNSGDPLGLMVRSGQLVSGPYSTRAFFAWGPAGAKLGYASMKGLAQSAGISNFAIDGLNQDCPQNAVVLNDESAGIAVGKLPNAVAVIRVDSTAKQWGLKATGTVESIATDRPRTAVEAGMIVLVGQGAGADRVSSLRVGAKVDLSVVLNGFDPKGLDHAIGGGPVLVKDGAIAVADKAEGFPPSFADVRHPRTAIGRSAAGDIWLVVTDGRTKVSAGATLQEMAQIMRGLGCTDALNLDGGGSSVMSIYGGAVNRPSDGRERAVANGVIVSWPTDPPVTDFGVRLVTQDGSFYARGKSGPSDIPDREIIWSTRGPITIDPDGRVVWVGAEGKSEEDGIARTEIPKAYVRGVWHGKAVELEVSRKVSPRR